MRHVISTENERARRTLNPRTPFVKHKPRGLGCSCDPHRPISDNPRGYGLFGHRTWATFNVSPPRVLIPEVCYAISPIVSWRLGTSSKTMKFSSTSWFLLFFIVKAEYSSRSRENRRSHKNVVQGYKLATIKLLSPWKRTRSDGTIQASHALTPLATLSGHCNPRFMTGVTHIFTSYYGAAVVIWEWKGDTHLHGAL